ncbi:rhodanese-like domain-containing protein [Lacisediminimonas sp.]|uniref:rhodanese-like domain-containing protein n=1 Tax=Lacisediminimonas sp. TaxID=3060582 RepID=UPI0027275FF2|nr:rhodanese-like domain-containing protein [Lacisediminimonas sp.]MDO8298530.1 rhodanese-like domain-containing protein [Lacisediminimonas sp.]
MKHLSVTELAQRLADDAAARPFLLDVREPWEFQTCHLEGATLMPMNTVPARQQELDPETEIVCICHHGARSMAVAAFLERNGFSNVINLTGGMHAWATQVDGSMPTY